MKGSFCVLLLVVAFSGPKPSGAQSCQRSYGVQLHTGSGITLDGKAEEEIWQQIPSDESFSFPWREGPPPGTVFKAFLNDETLYLYFRALENDLVLAEEPGERVVEKEDRVEVFFAVDPELNEYYCIEVDPLGRVMDYKASYYRRFDYSWQFEGLTAAAHRDASGYSVEIAIPIRTLTNLGLTPLKRGTRLRTGLFRAEFRHQLDGIVEEGWMSWCKPDSETPDFHIPSSFGFLTVE